MSDRGQAGLRGPVKSCTEEMTLTLPDTAGKTSEVHNQFVRTYDPEGRQLTTTNVNSDGSRWTSRNEYSPSGQLLRTLSGNEGQVQTEEAYAYDQQGREKKVTTSGREQTPVVFHYDGQGRKTQVVTSLPSDYRGDMATGGSPFEAAQMPPNLPGGGTATTIFDEHDRPKEIQIRDANGTILSRASRSYDAQGRIREEKQVQEDFMAMFPADALEKLKSESGLSNEQLGQELKAQLSTLMGGQKSIYSVSYQYDSDGRLARTSRRMFNHQDEIETTYNEHGDPESEITRSTDPDRENEPGSNTTSYSEVRYSYHYDDHGNWTEKSASYQTDSETAAPPTVTKRTLTYY